MVSNPIRFPFFQHIAVHASTIFFIALGIHLIGIDTLSLTSDECFSIYHAQMSPSLILHHLSTGNNPPLYEWILHDWMGWFGDSALAVRWLSAIFSSVTTALMYILGTQIPAQGNLPQQKSGNARIGLLAALLFLSSNYTTFLAHEARTYNLTLLLGVACTMLFLRAIQKPQTSTWIAYGFLGGILCLSHFFGAWILMAHMGYWLWTAHEKRWVMKSLLWVGLGFGISFGWYIPNLWHRFVDSASQGTWVNPAPWDAPYLTLWKYLNTPAATIIAMILLVYAVVKVVAQPTRTNNADVQKQHALLLLWLFALPFFGQWLLSLDHPFSIPMFTERYACITLPFLCLILAMALNGLREHFNQWLYYVVLPIFLFTILSGKNFTPPNEACVKEALQKTAKELEKSSIETTPIIIEPYHAAFQVLYYADHKRFQQYHPENIYNHLANQLSHSNIWILKTDKSLDSLGLSQKKSLVYLHFGKEKSNHTKRTESQLMALTNQGGKSRIEHIQLPELQWGTFEISHEAEFWLIEKN